MQEEKEINSDIILVLENTTKIESIKSRTGSKNIMTINQDSVQLSLNTIYKLPISNKKISLTESNCLSPIGKINEKIQILNVEEGVVTITPLIHGVFLKNKENLGKLI